jgi:hypothetical protein
MLLSSSLIYFETIIYSNILVKLASKLASLYRNNLNNAILGSVNFDISFWEATWVLTNFLKTVKIDLTTIPDPINASKLVENVIN